MEQPKKRLVEALVQKVRDLPEEEVAKVVAFADRLQNESAESGAERGSARAIYRAIDHSGPLRFEPGELEALLADVEEMRDLDERG